MIAFLDVGSICLKFLDGKVETITISSSILKLEKDPVVWRIEKAVNIHELQAAAEGRECEIFGQRGFKANDWPEQFGSERIVIIGSQDSGQAEERITKMKSFIAFPFEFAV
jgi:hypothetical protein